MGNNFGWQSFLRTTGLLLTFRWGLFAFWPTKSMAMPAWLLICVNFTMEIIVGIQSVSQPNSRTVRQSRQVGA